MSTKVTLRWRLVSKRPLPRIHLLSDLHLETGPYEIPPDIEYDILVAAGDIGPVEIAVPWLAALNKPVVYVLGNHERWGRSFDEAVVAARAAAKSTKVHVLEHNSVVINGVRFLGATLWTSYGSWHSGLVKTAVTGMRDYNEIDAATWYASASNIRWMRRMLRRIEFRVPTANECKQRTKFHPVIAYQIHLKTLDWLKKQLAKDFDGPTVVVTHHAPGFASLRAAGISDGLLDSKNWNNRDDELIRVGCYASPTKLRGGAYSRVDLWLHGHIHSAIDVFDEDVRVVCNPRGRHFQPFTQADVRALAFYGLSLSQDEIDASEARLRENPFMGEAFGFDPSLVIDFQDGYRRPLERMTERCLPELRRLIEQARETAPFANRPSRIGKWARRCFDADVHSFREEAERFQKGVVEPLWPSGNIAWQAPTLPLPPYDRFFDGAPPSTTAFSRCIESLEQWANWTESIPTLAVTSLQEWAETGVRILDSLHDKFACNAWLQMLPPRALRALDCNDFKLVVDSPSEKFDEMHAAIMGVLRVQKDTPASFRFASLRPLSDCSVAERARLLSLKTLQTVLACQ